jgi:nickel-dependent lactate racemase
MQGCDLCLPWGKEEIQFALPDDWQVAGMPQPAPLTPAQDSVAEVGRSLAQPIGSPRLRDVAQPDMKVALVIDDSSRPTPVNLILPAVLGELEQAGVKRASISLVTALGLHRSMPEEEIARRVGPAALTGLHWQNHNCDDMEQLAFLGTTQRGTPVFFNRTVAGADLVVCVGCIEPHIIASFGGGYKEHLF